MDELLFRTLSLAATVGFVLGLLQGWLPLILLSLLLAGVFVWLARKLG
ncbi:MAG: hypothetical protein ACPGFB_11105 [Verrucomicrobiales bacterium]